MLVMIYNIILLWLEDKQQMIGGIGQTIGKLYRRFALEGESCINLLTWGDYIGLINGVRDISSTVAKGYCCKQDDTL